MLPVAEVVQDESAQAASLLLITVIDHTAQLPLLGGGARGQLFRIYLQSADGLFIKQANSATLKSRSAFEQAPVGERGKPSANLAFVYSKPRSYHADIKLHRLALDHDCG